MRHSGRNSVEVPLILPILYTWRRILLAVDGFTYLGYRAGRIRRPDRHEGCTDPPRGLHHSTKLFRGTNHEITSCIATKEARDSRFAEESATAAKEM
jgi:hypothetical protein